MTCREFADSDGNSRTTTALTDDVITPFHRLDVSVCRVCFDTWSDYLICRTLCSFIFLVLFLDMFGYIC